MKSIKKSALAVAVIPLVLILAGCNTTNKVNAPDASKTPSAQTAATQGAPVDIFAASPTAIKGYRPIQLTPQRVIYVSPRPILNRSHITSIDVVKDTQGRTYVKLSLNPQGVALANSVPKNQGFATTVDGQLASLNGARQGSDFLFNVRDEQIAASIVQAIVPQQARR